MKGYIRTLEAVMSVILIFTFLVIINASQSRDNTSEDLTDKAYKILSELNRDLLRSNASSNDFTSINDSIDYNLHNHSVNVCEPDGTCHGPVPSGDDIWVGTYFIAGSDIYNPKLVKLYLYS